MQVAEKWSFHWGHRLMHPQYLSQCLVTYAGNIGGPLNN